MNFLNNNTIAGKIIRLPLKFIPSNLVIKIISGSNRGLKWIKGSGVNSYWLGNYEKDKQKFLSRLLKPGMTFYDIGAHVGFYSILGVKFVGEKGRVVSVEPVERNIRYIKRNVSLNSFDTVVKIIQAAVSNRVGKMYFFESKSNAGSFISVEGDKKIETITIDDLVYKTKTPPNVVKIDVQGATKQVLEGSIKTLKKYHPTLIIAIDNGYRPGQVHFSKKSIHDFLEKFDYKITDIGGNKITQKKIEEENEIVAKYKKL